MGRSQRSRGFAGRQHAESLAKWLNLDPQAGEQRRIDHLIQNCHEFLAFTKHEFKTGKFRSGQTGDDIKAEVDRWLRRYSEALEIEMVENPTEDFTGLEFRLKRREGSRVSRHEIDAFLHWFHLARDGNINKLRRCASCNRWIFVKFPQGDRAQKYCPGGTCQHKARVVYMREYMKKQRDKEKKENDRLKAAAIHRRR